MKQHVIVHAMYYSIRWMCIRIKLQHCILFSVGKKQSLTGSYVNENSLFFVFGLIHGMSILQSDAAPIVTLTASILCEFKAAKNKTLTALSDDSRLIDNSNQKPENGKN